MTPRNRLRLRLALSVAALTLTILSAINAGVATWHYHTGAPWEFDAFEAIYLWLLAVWGASSAKVLS